MNKKDLTDLGIAEDVADKVIVLHGKDIETHKSKLTTLQTEAEGYKTQLTEAAKTIEGFKGMDIEGVKKSADEWKTKAETAQVEAAKQVAALKFDHSLEKALADAKVKDVVAVKAHLKIDGLKLNEDGTLLGLKEQLEPLQKEKDYLFQSSEELPEIIKGSNNQSVLSDKVVDAARKAAGLSTSTGEK